jgi:hypothetical protein
MTAAMSAGTKEKVPFTSELRTGEVATVQHIRDHSNYLFPRGALNLFGNIVVYLRGIFANVALLLPWLTFAALMTIFLRCIDAAGMIPPSRKITFGQSAEILAEVGKALIELRTMRLTPSSAA